MKDPDSKSTVANSAAKDQFVDLLRKLPEFQSLTSKQLIHLVKFGPKVFSSGEILLAGDNQKEKNLVIMLAGSCNVEKPITVNNRIKFVLVTKVHSPAVFGEIGIFSTKPSVATVATAQRVVALTISHDTIEDLKKQTESIVRSMNLSFARLGVARCQKTASKYATILKELFGEHTPSPGGFKMSISRIESAIEKGLDYSTFGRDVFDQISDLLERIDYAMAMAHYIKLLPDFKIPSDEEIDLRPDDSFSAEAVRILTDPGSRGKTIKHAIADNFVKRLGEGIIKDDYIPCLEEMVNLIDELMTFLPKLSDAFNRRNIQRGDNEMLEGFMNRITTEMDYICRRAMEEFGYGKLPDHHDAGEKQGKLSSYLIEKMSDMKLRVAVENLDSGYILEFRDPADVTRRKVAVELYNKLKTHPAVRLIMSANCKESRDDNCSDMFNDVPIMSEFFCKGCRIIVQAGPD